ncbi:hypothetical protein GDO78_017671 [Eleutherodactylus coqui]|uniref:Ig-like domain-containing protein n=1 Tax=Eleutherodactylus coqui TaxID=57060 RepID=A0A8J6C7R2_ELECQ|nr:hypothetical protein GDO78_017671 [Eleutherodactylus coqui]
MASQGLLLGVLLMSLHGSCAQIVLTVSPEYTAVSPGDTVIFSCTCSSDVPTSRLHWYQQKPEQPPKLLIYGTSNRQPGVPERFSGSRSGTNYKFTITGLTKDDIAHYFCYQHQSLPLTQ